MKVFVELFVQENEQCLRALLDTSKTQWKEMITIISRGKNDEVEALADQLKKLFEDGAGPKEKLRTLFVEKFNGLEAIKTSLSDQRRSNERAIALIDLLITIFDVKSDYQEQFVSIGGIPVVTDILKSAGSLEGKVLLTLFIHNILQCLAMGSTVSISWQRPMSNGHMSCSKMD